MSRFQLQTQPVPNTYQTIQREPAVYRLFVYKSFKIKNQARITQYNMSPLRLVKTIHTTFSSVKVSRSAKAKDAKTIQLVRATCWQHHMASSWALEPHCLLITFHNHKRFFFLKEYFSIKLLNNLTKEFVVIIFCECRGSEKSNFDLGCIFLFILSPLKK